MVARASLSPSVFGRGWKLFGSFNEEFRILRWTVVIENKWAGREVDMRPIAEISRNIRRF
jgi:hypothetical protein